MKRVFLKIAYDGTCFHGFQAQKGLRTVEGELGRALCALTGEDIKLAGASRTDSGVHALGNVAVFDTSSPIPAERFPFALIRYLPEDLRAVFGAEVPVTWHPAKQESVKCYEYVYSVGRIENPKERLYSSFINRDPLKYPDTAAMRAAAAYLAGEHDFTSFSNPDSQALLKGGSAVRKIYSIDIFDSFENADARVTRAEGKVDPTEEWPAWSRAARVMRAEGKNRARIFDPLEGGAARGRSGKERLSAMAPGFSGTGMEGGGREIRIRITGNGFLYNMVRIMAGTLMNVGLGVTAPEKMPEILSLKNRSAAGPTAEARGLTLIGVSYELP